MRAPVRLLGLCAKRLAACAPRAAPVPLAAAVPSARGSLFLRPHLDPRRTMATVAQAAQVPSATVGGELKSTIYFTIPDRTGALERVLSYLSNTLEVSLKRIESRPSATSRLDYDIIIEWIADNVEEVDQVVKGLKSLERDKFSGLGLVKEVRVVGIGDAAYHASQGEATVGVPWFPRKKSDLDAYSDKILQYGVELDADHPGFKDERYRERRIEIARKAKEYRHGQPLPRAEYTPEEVGAWGVVYDKLQDMHRRFACKEFRYVWPLLESECGYRRDNIPQLEDVSRFLKATTGFTLRPVAGLLSPRDFLNGLAFRVFHATQYIRHPAQPLYTPEPDVCHELIGHVPLFADPDVADLSQEIGLASLGASEEEIKRLSTLYWFTLEFGIVSQPRNGGGGNDVRAYGAGLLSSFGELDWAIAKGGQPDGPKWEPFDPDLASRTEYGITAYQPKYFLAGSFAGLKDQILLYTSSPTNFSSRPFAVRYNALTEQIEVLDSKERLVRFARQVVRGDLGRLLGAVERL
ncbi:Biopterin-dependent aromatic amino acid hydroxylase-domain-containing protein [Hyaloraphidium curvatum]|nr:Biopterin-dependent aromatic amino acid hydroxylase-domain-containing protein [Hyaloraphidium curvatum]